MADNITAPATGAVLATDDVGGIQYPRVKVSWGTDGAAVDVSATNPLPVALAGSLGVTGTFWQATQPVSIAGTVAVSNASGATSAKQDALLTATNLIVAAVQDTTPAAVTQSGTWSFGLTGTLPAFAATPTVDTVVKSTAVSRSTTAGTGATQLMAANAARRGIYVQNQHASAKIYINGVGTAVAGDGSSLMIGPGQLYESNVTHSGTGAISIISDTAATPVYAREW